MSDAPPPGSKRSLLRTGYAFLRVGFIDAMTYPLTMVLAIGQPLSNVFLYYFMARLVGPHPLLLGGDYFTFAIVGVIVLRMLGAGLEEFGLFVQRTIDQGQLELYLVQPVSARALPFVWFEWALVLRLLGGIVTVLLALVLGARFDADQLPQAALVLALGVGAAHAIGVIAASIRVLAKRADPVLLLYTVASAVFSGLFVPIQLLPRWLQHASWGLPHTYVADALRQLVLDGGEAESRISVTGAIMALVAFNVVAYSIGLLMFDRALRFARRHGLVGTY